MTLGDRGARRPRVNRSLSPTGEAARASHFLGRRSTMRKMIPMLAVAVLFSGMTLLVRAADEKTIKGEGQCAKCHLKETKTCQNTVTSDEGGKKVTYYLAANAVSKKFHSNICQEK